MKLVVGLGNPGGDYRDTYHNMGFMSLDMLAARFDAPAFCFDKKSNADLCSVHVGGEKVILCKPTTYMNLSGNAVSAVSEYYKIAPRDILVIYDDIDIAKGTVRARASGSAGTHNGMRDIVQKLGSVDFARVRVGTGFKPEYMRLDSYVLSHIPSAEKPLLDRACAAACDFAESFIKGEEWRSLTVSVL
ncbi:MAG: aminoacyl-tRNA hydrolase [Roseburia sp.]|nr:aminoacyl-tRNA hydrolase [Roseburia sp.]